MKNNRTDVMACIDNNYALLANILIILFNNKILQMLKKLIFYIKY